MSAEFIIVNWLLERLRKENLIDGTLYDGAKRLFLQNLLKSKSVGNSESEKKVA